MSEPVDILILCVLLTQLLAVLQLKFPYSLKSCGFSTQALVNDPVGGTVDVPLAQTGEGIAECELLKWFVQEVSNLSISVFHNGSVICLLLIYVMSFFQLFPRRSLTLLLYIDSYYTVIHSLLL